MSLEHVGDVSRLRTPIVLWVVGEPAVGKTSMIRLILGDLDSYKRTKPKWTIREPDGAIVAAGHYTGDRFDGADRVPYAGAQDCLDVWREILQRKARLTILDGDRFSNAKVVEFFADKAVRRAVVQLTASERICAARRKARGTEQNEAWVKGRRTKAERFSRLVEPRHVVYTGDKTPEQVTADVWEFLEGLTA